VPQFGCALGEHVYITSHQNKQLEDRKGTVSVHSDKGSWQRWTITKVNGSPACAQAPAPAPAPAAFAYGPNQQFVCPGGHTFITTAAECESAASILAAGQWNGEADYGTGNPKWCFYNGGDQAVYFNQGGSSNGPGWNSPEDKPVCKKAVTVCTADQYESTAPTATSDRECKAVTVCTANQYETTAPTATSDRVCKATDVVVFDGCKKSGEAPVPQVVSPTSKKLASTPRGATSSTIATRCCRGEGASLQCASSTASGCLPKGADYASSARACEMIGTGWGLCTKAQLLTGKCCGTGCNYDQHYTWTADTPQATSPSR
jgi:hypothetical protein